MSETHLTQRFQLDWPPAGPGSLPAPLSARRRSPRSQPAVPTQGAASPLGYMSAQAPQPSPTPAPLNCRPSSVPLLLPALPKPCPRHCHPQKADVAVISWLISYPLHTPPHTHHTYTGTVNTHTLCCCF